MREVLGQSRGLLVMALGALALLLGAACTTAQAMPSGTDAQGKLARPRNGDVLVTAREFGFELSQSTFKVGVPYRFIVINKGAISHEAMLMPLLERLKPKTETMPSSTLHKEASDGAMTSMGPGEMHEESAAEMAAHEEESTETPGAMPGGHEEMHSVVLGLIEAKDLPPGATRSFEVTFTEPAEGTLELACRLPGHYEAGMHSPIKVLAVEQAG